MLISLNWIRDFVDLPGDVDPHGLAERFTRTCAEVEGIERIETAARGLVGAKVTAVAPLPDTRNLHRVRLDTGGGNEIETVTAAPDLSPGDRVVYAPSGGHVRAIGEVVSAQVAGHRSEGMILSGEAVGMALSAGQAVFLPPSTVPGERLDASGFDDWVIDIDNKSITHRPDLWGHYGIARELAALYGVPLKDYPVSEMDALSDPALPEIPIEIDDPEACPRYTGLRIEGVGSQPAPLWMQLRLGHVGLRPIDCLVDLTNYIMLELGQPMHAFDGDHIDRIEVGWSEPDSTFTTLDGSERTMPPRALMILCCRKAVALAGIMGGLATEVSSRTRSLLLESANFDAATIRRCATTLGMRTDASARFEKSLDPENTVLAIRRFLHLARREFSGLALKSRLSDCHPRPARLVEVKVDPVFVNRFMGHCVSKDEIVGMLSPLGFGVTDDGEHLTVRVPSWRATKDISIEADVIEEIARCVGYDNIEPRLPRATVRCFASNVQHDFEQRTLRAFCDGEGYHEIHRYLWYDDTWLDRLGYEPPASIQVRNPITEKEHRLRHVLMPDMLAAMDLNRHHLDAFRLIEVGSVYPPGSNAETEHRHLGLLAAQRVRGAEDGLLRSLKGAIETWAGQVLGVQAAFRRPSAVERLPWVHERKTATVVVAGESVGTVSVLPLEIRHRMDEHLKAWSAAWAELRLDDIAAGRPPVPRLEPIPSYPQIDLDFSVLTDADRDYAEIAERVARFEHGLLVRVSYVGAYEGESIPRGKRSLTFRTRIAHGERTLTEEDLNAFRRSFEAYLEKGGLALRR